MFKKGGCIYSRENNIRINATKWIGGRNNYQYVPDLDTTKAAV